MAVDANVLVFERAREEQAARTRPSTRSSLTAGFRSAFSAIADSNVTTLIAAALLFFLASGPVKGFGVTLGIGVLASMVSALVITRVLADTRRDRPGVSAAPHHSAISTPPVPERAALRRRSVPDCVRRRRCWPLACPCAAGPASRPRHDFGMSSPAAADEYSHHHPSTAPTGLGSAPRRRASLPVPSSPPLRRSSRRTES
ncbi:MMPL family transporter [Streptomyces sp. DHE17-7]|uniref:MMPL family transporter n=1 Tax=Streptomyces sp. DHE17-7 TaxID=2759949 RepID=UPI0022EA8740|nr:MMPL family transporter [Streptomyces sp. DHE17-7]